MDTRHNFGFLCLDELSRLYRADSAFELIDEGVKKRVARWERWRGPDSTEFALLWPLTFMNVSGEAIAYLSGRFGPPAKEELLVVIDDMSLPLGQLRLRKKGSSGGHNGLKSIEALLGHQDYARLRLGIGSPPPHQDVIEFVLASFEPAELPDAKSVVQFAAASVQQWTARVSFEGLVGKVNGWRLPKAVEKEVLNDGDQL